MDKEQVIATLVEQSAAAGVPLATLFRASRLSQAVATTWKKEPRRMSAESLEKLDVGLTHVITCLGVMLKAVRDARGMRDAA